jgi:hypothetical protein
MTAIEERAVDRRQVEMILEALQPHSDRLERVLAVLKRHGRYLPVEPSCANRYGTLCGECRRCHLRELSTLQQLRRHRRRSTRVAGDR